MVPQKKIRRCTDVIDIFGINAFALDPLQCKLLYMEIPRVMARRELRTRNMKVPLVSDKLFDLILLATGDEDQADKAKTSFIMEQMKSGEEVH